MSNNSFQRNCEIKVFKNKKTNKKKKRSKLYWKGNSKLPFPKECISKEWKQKRPVNSEWAKTRETVPFRQGPLPGP